MAKVIWKQAGKDDPIYSGGFKTSSPKVYTTVQPVAAAPNEAPAAPESTKGSKRKLVK